MGLECKIPKANRVGCRISILLWPLKLKWLAKKPKLAEMTLLYVHSCVRFQEMNNNSSAPFCSVSISITAWLHWYHQTVWGLWVLFWLFVMASNISGIFPFPTCSMSVSVNLCLGGGAQTRRLFAVLFRVFSLKRSTGGTWFVLGVKPHPLKATPTKQNLDPLGVLFKSSDEYLCPFYIRVLPRILMIWFSRLACFGNYAHTRWWW